MNMLVYLTAQNSSSSRIQQLPLAPPWLSHSTVRELERRALLLSWKKIKFLPLKPRGRNGSEAGELALPRREPASQLLAQAAGSPCLKGKTELSSNAENLLRTGREASLLSQSECLDKSSGHSVALCGLMRLDSFPWTG